MRPICLHFLPLKSRCWLNFLKLSRKSMLMSLSALENSCLLWRIIPSRCKGKNGWPLSVSLLHLKATLWLYLAHIDNLTKKLFCSKGRLIQSPFICILSSPCSCVRSLCSIRSLFHGSQKNCSFLGNSVTSTGMASYSSLSMLKEPSVPWREEGFWVHLYDLMDKEASLLRSG